MTIVHAMLLFALAAPDPMRHVRSEESALRQAVEIGSQLSPAFRAILDRLNASDVIVHIAYDLQPPAGTAGRITLATVAGGVRYLRISISPKLRGCDLVAILGHELQHAVEIADAPWVTSQKMLAALYREVGFHRGDTWGETFDSDAAIATGERVRREMIDVRRTVVAPDGYR